MPAPKMIGTINGFSASPAKIGRKSFMFDGTTRGLVNAARANGAKAGTKVQANYGGGFKSYVIISAPHDDRCGGLWVK
jgi:hypothetical protein